MNARNIAVVFFALLAISVQANTRLSDATWARLAVARYKIAGIDASQKGFSKRKTALQAFLVSQKIVEISGSISRKITALEKRVNAMDDQAKVSDSETKSLRDAVTDLKMEMNGLNSVGDDVDRLKQMLKTFKSQFRELGIDVRWMLSNFKDIASRMAKLEQKTVRH